MFCEHNSLCILTIVFVMSHAAMVICTLCVFAKFGSVSCCTVCSLLVVTLTIAAQAARGLSFRVRGLGRGYYMFQSV